MLFEPIEGWARAMVYEPLGRCVSKVALGRALAKNLGMRGVISITPILESRAGGGGVWVFFVKSINIAKFYIRKGSFQ